jgi:hypothetical protein
MPEMPPFSTTEQWIERLTAWAVERWGQERAEALRSDIEATAHHLAVLFAYPLTMEQIPGFFME